MHEVLVNSLGGLSLPRKSVVRLTDRPDMTLDVYLGRKITNQHQLAYKSKYLLKPYPSLAEFILGRRQDNYIDIKIEKMSYNM